MCYQADGYEDTTCNARKACPPRWFILLEQEGGRLGTRIHVLGEKPPSNGCRPYLSDKNLLENAQELRLADFAEIATSLNDYLFPPPLSRSAIPTILVDSTPAGIMIAAVTSLLATAILPNKASTNPLDGEPEGLSCAPFDDICDMDR